MRLLDAKNILVLTVWLVYFELTHFLGGNTYCV